MRNQKSPTSILLTCTQYKSDTVLNLGALDLQMTALMVKEKGPGEVVELREYQTLRRLILKGLVQRAPVAVPLSLEPQSSHLLLFRL